MDNKVIAFILIISFLLTGCWDKIEIEDRAHISSVGIDKYKGPIIDEKPANPYVFTFSFPEHKKDDAKDIVVSTVGETLYSVSRIMADRSNRQIFLGHLRTIIIGSDIAKDPKVFRQILDGIENSEFISRRVVLAITEDSAQEVINVVPAMENRLGEFISGLFRRTDRIPRTVGSSVGDILKDLHENGNTIIPKIMPGETDVKVAGAGIISDFQFKGWLGEMETAHLLVLKGQAKYLSGMSIEYRGHTIPVDLRPKKPKFTLVRDKNNIKILIEVEMEGDIKQTYFEAEEDMLNAKNVEEIENMVQRVTEERATIALNKIQKEFETDVLGIDRYLRQSHYKLWKEVEGDWRKIFPNIDIHISTDIKIRRVGLIR